MEYSHSAPRVGGLLQTPPSGTRTLVAFTGQAATLKTDWLKALDEATTIEQVIDVVEDFVESRSDVYWTGVPQDLRRPEIANEAQLQQWHHALVQAISRMPSPGSPMQELAVFSLRAAVRIHQIRLREDRTRPSNEGFDGKPSRDAKASLP